MDKLIIILFGPSVLFILLGALAWLTERQG